WEFAMFSAIVILVLTVIYGIMNFSSGYNGLIISRYSLSLVPSIGIDFTSGATSLTFTLLLLTAVIIPISVYSAKDQKYGELFFGLILLSEVGLFGLLISRNFVFFYVFWEIVIVPVFLLIAIYGGEKKEAASLKFFIYTQLGSVFLLLSILTLFAYHYSLAHNFSLSMTTLL
ncbi:NADH dehydrogenase subunit M, partial [mine drainage metagenome]